MGWKTGKGTNRRHRAPPQASSYQGPHGPCHDSGQSLGCQGRIPPLAGPLQKALGPAPRRPLNQQHPRPLPRGTACMPRCFRTCRGLAPCPKPRAPGLAARWPALAKSGLEQDFFATRASRQRPKQPEPRPGVGSRTGCGRSSSSSEARPRGDYNVSLLCLGHFKVKFSSMNVQPVSLAQG